METAPALSMGIKRTFKVSGSAIQIQLYPPSCQRAAFQPLRLSAIARCLRAQSRRPVRASAGAIVRYAVLRRTIPTLRPLRAARANRVFCTDEKHIRTENTVTVNTKHRVEVLYKIVDCARICFSSVRNRRSARTVSRPRYSAALQQRGAAIRVAAYDG